MKPVEVENVGFMSNFVKSFTGQQKNRKTPFSVINANFTYFCIPKKKCSFIIKKVETLRFSNMYNTYGCPSSMWMLSFGEGRKMSENGECYQK